nr:hypothetical protein Iba_scaffold2300CG0900 [Ipomoea batatas]
MKYSLFCNWHSSPTRIACFRPGRLSGITDTHSLNWAASSMISTLNGSISIECILHELEVVQKTKVDVFKHKSFIKYLVAAYGRSSSPKEYRRVFSKARHWLLKHTKGDESANDLGGNIRDYWL